METSSTGDRNWPMLAIVAFLLGLIFLDISLILGGTLDQGGWFLIAGGIPLWVALLIWSTRTFVRSRRFYCNTPACAITGRKKVFMPRRDEWVCTQCKKPLTTQVFANPQAQQPMSTPPYTGSTGGTFLGGIAGLRIYRFKGSGQVNVVSGYRNPWGYGLYFTDENLVGVSYTKYLSRAYKPGWILSVTWPAILVLTIAWFAVTHTQDLPLWWIPIFPVAFFGSMIGSLVFLLYLSPKRASNQIDRIQVSSMKDLELLQKDVILRRDDISEINFRGTRVYDPGHGYSRGVILSISSKTGPPVIFVSTNRVKSQQLVQLVQTFAMRDPPIRQTEN